MTKMTVAGIVGIAAIAAGCRCHAAARSSRSTDILREKAILAFDNGNAPKKETREVMPLEIVAEQQHKCM